MLIAAPQLKAIVIPLLFAMSEYRSSWWSIDLLPGWSADEQPDCVAFARDDGVGALQISAYKHD
jgi:hypothetical protein